MQEVTGSTPVSSTKGSTKWNLFLFMAYSVYILYSALKDRYYVGHTEDVQRRIEEHNLRKNLSASDWVIKYLEKFETRGEAMKRELEIKNKKRRSYIESLIVKE